MKHIKLQLLSACAVASVFAATAQAQVALPAAELRGVGASTIGDVNVRTLNCVGNPGNHVAGDTVNNRSNKLGTNSNQLLTIAPGKYNPTSPTAANPVYDCEVSEIQPNFEGKYVSTGSGFGRQMWRLFSNQFTGAAGSQNPFGTWNNVQFAFSEAPATASDITAYNANANNATNKAGPAIQIPFYVIPVALAYNPVYATKQTGSGPIDLKFRVKVPASINGVVAGGLRLNKAAYCKIFNGVITNWNDPALKTLNGAQELRDVNDDLSRWNTEGAPIRLVGRLDKSGGSDIFTRHLAAVCDSHVAVNKFDKASEALPYDPGSSINMTGFRPDSPYVPGAPAGNFSGNVQSISGAFFNRSTSQIVTTQGNEAAGLFMLADGASGVAAAIEATANNALVTSSIDANVKLNGKFGYVGADFVKPVPGRNLFAAALQKGASTTAYTMPSAVNGVAAFGTILPPQSTATSGAYNIADPRTNSVTGLPVDRANPLDWADVLYSGTATLANPANGYAFTGPAFMDTYTCFASASTRFNLVELIGLTLGKITKTSTNSPISANTFKGTGTTAVGIFAQSNTAPLSGAWANAINETFLKKSTQDGDSTAVVAKLGDRNLWIQDKLPTTAAHVDGTITATDPKSNPVCTAGAGA